MRLHDPATEVTVLRIAEKSIPGGGMKRTDVPLWKRALAFLLKHPAMMLFAIFYLHTSDDGTRPEIIQQALCVILLMLVIRHGNQMVGVAFSETGFFSTLVNLPVTRRTALLFTRFRLVRLFAFASIGYSVLAAAALRNFSISVDWAGFFIDSLLFTGIVWSTILLANSSFLRPRGIVNFWNMMGSALIVCVLLYPFSEDSEIAGNQFDTQLLSWITYLQWLFPPAWILPGKISGAGLFLVGIWLALGLREYLRWPTVLFPLYDKPGDFLGAFGGCEIREEPAELAVLPEEAEDEGGSLVLLQPLSLNESGWVEKLVGRFISEKDKHLIGAMIDPSPNWTRRTNLSLAFAPLWIALIWLCQVPINAFSDKELPLFVIGAVTLICAIYFLMPAVNSTPRALQSCTVGNTQVPFFCTLPIAVRDLYRISQRIAIVRGIIAAAIATPIFWAIGEIIGLPNAAGGLILAVPFAIAAWVFSCPYLILSRNQANTKRKHGIFFLHHAMGIFYICLGLLCLAASISATILAFIWAAGFSEERFVFLMLPAAVASLLLSATIARVGLEFFISSLHWPGYNWQIPQK